MSGLISALVVVVVVVVAVVVVVVVLVTRFQIQSEGSGCIGLYWWLVIVFWWMKSLISQKA